MSPDRSPRQNGMTTNSRSDLPSISEDARLPPTSTVSSITIEAPTAPEPGTPEQPDSFRPTVTTPRADETIHAALRSASATKEERGWRLGYFSLVTLVFALATAAAFAWNWKYVARFLELPRA